MNEILALCDELLKSDDERLQCLLAAAAVVRERVGISQAKAEGGTRGEFIAALHFGLDSEKVGKTGADAFDEEGRRCEIKAPLHPSKKHLATAKPSINYRCPVRKEGELDDDYCARILSEAEKDEGGHFWITYDPKAEKDAVVLSWWVPCLPFAQFALKKARQSANFSKGRPSFNLGGRICAKCHDVHRATRIAKGLGGWVGQLSSLDELRTLRKRDHQPLPSKLIEDLDEEKCPAQCK